MANQAVDEAESILATLKLELNREKTSVTTFKQGFEYLGTLFLGKLKLPGKKAREKSKVRWRLPRRRK